MTANPTDEVATTPAYDWRKTVDAARDLILGNLADDLAAYIERLEAERDALLAEHEAVAAYRDALRDSACKIQRRMMLTAHDSAERVIHALTLAGSRKTEGKS